MRDRSMVGEYTFRLLRNRLSFKDGIVGVFDVANLVGEKRYNFDQTEVVADTNAIKSDWEAVGSDMRQSLEQYEKETKQA